MKKIIFLATCYFLLATNSLAQVRINEFTIEPDQSAEIINIGSDSADISNWIIDDSGGTTFYTIPEDSILLPNSCLVYSGSFNLNKSSSDTVRLLNGTTLIDSFTYSTSPGLNISFQRLPDASETWATGAASLGNFNESGQSCVITPTVTPTIEPTLTPTPTPRKKATPTPDDEESVDSPSTGSSILTEEINPTQEIEVYNLNGKPGLTAPNAEVLGEFSPAPPKTRIHRLMALLSISYSALTVLGILLKIRLGA